MGSLRDYAQNDTQAWRKNPTFYIRLNDVLCGVFPQKQDKNDVYIKTFIWNRDKKNVNIDKIFFYNSKKAPKGLIFYEEQKLYNYESYRRIYLKHQACKL